MTLVIEYVFEGHQRGYNFTAPTDGYTSETLKTIWRNAMARGQGWGTYTGSRSIKGFALPDDMIAVSEVTVTDLEDESGRRGIRHAVIDVMTPKVFALHLQSRLAGYPAAVVALAEDKVKVCQQRAGRLKKEMPLVITRPFTTMQDWWITEALILKLVESPGGAMRRWGEFIPFTTLALDYRNESRLVALPAETPTQIDVPLTNLS